MCGNWRVLCIMGLMVLGACSSNLEKGPLVKDMGDYREQPLGAGVNWEFIELLGLEKWGPMLNLHDNPSLNGEPAMVLDVQGLIYKGYLLCSWPGGRFDREKSYSMVLQGCPQGLPITSTLGGGGSGDAQVMVAVFGRQPNGLAQTTFSGTTLYMFLGQEGVNWRPASAPGR